MNKAWGNILCIGQSLFDAPESYTVAMRQQAYGIVFMNILIWGFIFFYIINKIKKYRETSYYAITKNSYLKVLLDKGLLGEYAIYKKLQYLEKDGVKFLFNVYVPKENGETTEIDVLMICLKGIYVMESKNYSGWIFGNETQKSWTQTLPRGRGRSLKTKFLNPIIQNKGHIKHLKNIVGSDVDIKSIIVFSERCTFKDLALKSEEIKVINRHELIYTVEDMLKRVPRVKVEQKMIDELYEKLYPYTQISNVTKAQHIKNIQKMLEPEMNEILEVETVSVRGNCKVAGTDEKENIVVGLEKSEVLDHSMAVPEDICPRCGGKLVKRMARTGKYAGNSFMGCSNYPKCRYIKNDH